MQAAILPAADGDHCFKLVRPARNRGQVGEEFRRDDCQNQEDEVKAGGGGRESYAGIFHTVWRRDSGTSCQIISQLARRMGRNFSIR